MEKPPAILKPLFTGFMRHVKLASFHKDVSVIIEGRELKSDLFMSVIN